MRENAPLRIGTRGSRLALWQAHAVRDAIAQAHAIPPEHIEIVPIRTAGDAIRDRPLSEAGGKGLFSKEIEAALLERRVDLAVHSAKDMETFLPAGLVIGACLPREDVRDALIARPGATLETLPEGARVGTASLRREAMLKRLRPDIETALLRGNVPTRIASVRSGAFDATLLALAGLKRLGLEGEIAAILPLETMPPACGQGAVAVECRQADTRVRDLLSRIDHVPTSIALACERAYLAALDGSCRTPVAGYARIESGALVFDGLVLSPDGSESYEGGGSGAPDQAEEVGRAAGEDILRRAPATFLMRVGVAARIG